jgi:hypothetical protein
MTGCGPSGCPSCPSTNSGGGGGCGSKKQGEAVKQKKCPLSCDWPPHCVAGAAAGLGASLLIASWHKGVSRLSMPCVAGDDDDDDDYFFFLGTLACTGALTAAVVHHAMKHRTFVPQW